MLSVGEWQRKHFDCWIPSDHSAKRIPTSKAPSRLGVVMARASGQLVMTGSKDREYSMTVEFFHDITPHQLRKGGYYLGRKTHEAMTEELYEVSSLQSSGTQGGKPEDRLCLKQLAIASTDQLRNVELQSARESSKPEKAECKPSATVSFQYNNIGDTVMGSELDDAGPGPMQKLLADIFEFEVVIDGLQIQCHAYPFALKSSFFRNSFSEKKYSNREDRSKLQIPLILPGGSQTFELIRNFCYDSRVHITEENFLNLLSASISLGFTEAIAPDNLYERCQRFIDKEGTDRGIQGILRVLALSKNINSTDCNILITKLAEHALAIQNFEDENTSDIVELLMELAKLDPNLLDATLQEFGRLGVNMIDFFWCTEAADDLVTELLLSGDEDTRRNKRCIFSHVSEALDKSIAEGEVQIDRIDPKKLVWLFNPGVLRRPMLSEEAVKAYVSTKLSHLEAEDIMYYLHPRLVRDLVSTAVAASRESMTQDEEVQHLAGLIDQVLRLDALRCPWDGSPESKEDFKEIAMCVPLGERVSHDLLFDAVESFVQSFTQEADDIWDMLDPFKLGEAKFEAAISHALSHRENYYVHLLRRRQDNHTSLKRKLSVFEVNKPKRKSRKILDYCGALFTVFVRSLDGKTFSSLLVESDTTVNVIKEEIAKTESSQLQRFWWPVDRGKKPHESQSIASYGIQKDCTLYCT